MEDVGQRPEGTRSYAGTPHFAQGPLDDSIEIPDLPIKLCEAGAGLIAPALGCQNLSIATQPVGLG